MSRTLPDYNQLMRFTINDVCCWLGENRFGEFVRMFREHGVDGNRFITLTDLDLTKMSCPMNKRKDLLRLIKDLPKPDASRVKNVVQPRTPAAPERDYNAHRGRPPAPIPTSSHTQQNGNDDYYDDDSGSGPEDDYEWNKSDFSEVSSEEEQDYENDIDKLPPAPQRPKPATPDEESDNPSDYEEPETTPGPPPSIPSRGAPTAPRNTGPVPMNRRPVPQIPPPEEDQSIYCETNDDDDQQFYDETENQPVYDAPEEQEQKSAPAVKKPGGRRQLPIPGEQSKPTRGGAPMPQRTISEPQSPAPPPPRNKSKPIMNRVPEQTAPVQPPPPRGGRRVQPPPEPEQEIYEEPDESPAQPSPLSSRPTPPPPRSQPPVIEQEEFYEDPDNTTSEPVEQEEFYEDPDNQTSNTKPEPIEQEMYEETDSAPPSQPPPLRNRVLPPAPKAASHPPRPGKKAPPVQEETYEVTDNTDGPTEHYMEMQPTQEVKKSTPNKTAERTMPPRPGGRNRPMPDIPVSEPPKPERKADSLDDQPWYHGDIERPAADGKLTANGTNGCYLIRRSKKGGETKPYTLAIFYSGQVFNLNIRKKPSKKYALGNAKPDEQEFEDLFKVVEFFQSHRLILAKGQTRLKTPCPK